MIENDERLWNAGEDAFDFTAALHTYIEVVDIADAKVEGLQGLEYLDKVGACNLLHASTWPGPGKIPKVLCSFPAFKHPHRSAIPWTPVLATLQSLQATQGRLIEWHKGSTTCQIWHAYGHVPRCVTKMSPDRMTLVAQVADINNPAKRKEEREFVTFDGPVDSVYANAPERVALEVGTGEGLCNALAWCREISHAWPEGPTLRAHSSLCQSLSYVV